VPVKWRLKVTEVTNLFPDSDTTGDELFAENWICVRPIVGLSVGKSCSWESKGPSSCCECCDIAHRLRLELAMRIGKGTGKSDSNWPERPAKEEGSPVSDRSGA
jgi:hypothetical protein